MLRNSLVSLYGSLRCDFWIAPWSAAYIAPRVLTTLRLAVIFCTERKCAGSAAVSCFAARYLWSKWSIVRLSIKAHIVLTSRCGSPLTSCYCWLGDSLNCQTHRKSYLRVDEERGKPPLLLFKLDMWKETAPLGGSGRCVMLEEQIVLVGAQALPLVAGRCEVTLRHPSVM